MNHESVVQLLEQMQSILLDTMNHFHLTTNYDSSYSVLSRMRTSDQEPNDMEEFKQFQKGFLNELRSFIDYYYSPKREILKIANLVMATLKNDKEKVEKIHKFSDDDVLYHRTEIYNNNIEPMLKKYREFAKLCDQEISISFSYKKINLNFEFPFYNACPIYPNNSLQVLIQQCNIMSNLILNANNKNSMGIFNAMYTLFENLW